MAIWTAGVKYMLIINSVPLNVEQSESIRHYAGSLLLVSDDSLENHTTELTLNINFSQHLNWHHPNTIL